PATTAGVAWKPVSSLPRATRAADGSLVFDAVGPLSSGQTKTLKLNAEVDAGSPPGTITNRAVAAGVCADAPMRGGAEATTTVGTGLVPTVPPPAGNLGRNRQPSATGSSATGERASGTATSSSSVTRSASATGKAQSATRPAAGGSQTDT